MTISRMVVLSVVLVGGAVYVEHAAQTNAVPNSHTLGSLPFHIAEWRGREAPFAPEVVEALGVDQYLNRVYEGADGSVVALYVGYYQSQRQGDTVHSPMNCLPGAGWQSVQHTSLAVGVLTPAGTRRVISVNQHLVRKGANRQLLLYWYQGRGRVVANEYASKAYMALDALRQNRTDQAVVRVLTPILDAEPHGGAAAARAAAFVDAMFPHLSALLPS